jgi:hypothetical protein
MSALPFRFDDAHSVLQARPHKIWADSQSKELFGVFIQGRYRLLILVLLVVGIVAAFGVVGAKTRTDKSAAATPTSNINGGTTATPEQVDRLKSYGLLVTEVPSGSQLRVGEEFRNYAAAGGSAKDELAFAKQGRVDGFYQVWINTANQFQFQTRSDLYDSPSAAKSELARARSASAGQVQEMNDPKLGDSSRMYSFTTDQSGQKYEGWDVQWARGRTIFEVDGLGPVGSLHSDDVLRAAQAVDARAQKSPIN